MNVSAASDITSYLMTSATEMKNSNVQQSISTAILKQVLDQQKMEGQALVRMLQPDGSGGYLGQFLDIKG